MIWDSRTLYFAYSHHATREAAEMALEDYFAQGIICESECPYVQKVGRGKRPWCVFFPGV